MVTVKAKAHFRRAATRERCRRAYLKGANLQSCRDDIDQHQPPADPTTVPIQVTVFFMAFIWESQQLKL